MANELTLSASLKYEKGTRKVDVGKSGVQLDVAGTDHVTFTQTVGTTEEALKLIDAGTPGYCFIRNLDSANFVEIRAASAGDDCIKIPAGGIALFMLGSDATAPYAIADTAEVELEVTIIEA